MEAVLRRLKLKKGEPQDNEARKRLQQDLFASDQVSWVCILCTTSKCNGVVKPESVSTCLLGVYTVSQKMSHL